MVSLKKKSKRRTTRLRNKIEKQAASAKRKERKLAKKNPQWKSRIPKDPGIPNSFPFKEELLAQIEDQKRIKEEERMLRKQAAKENNGDGDMAIEDAAMNEEGEQESMMERLAKVAQANDAEDGSGDMVVMDEDDDGADVPQLVSNDADTRMDGSRKDLSRKAFDKEFKKVIQMADVILYVLDARDPEGTRSRDVERQVLMSVNEDKRLIFVVNKIDLVPLDVLNKWLKYLRTFFPAIPLRSSSSNLPNTFNHKSLTVSSTSSNLFKSLKAYAAKKKLKSSLTVGVIGYPNVGKSSVINALVTRSINLRQSGPCPTGNVAGVTTSLREVKLDNKLRLIDCPGIVFPNEQGKEDFERLMLLNAVPDKANMDYSGVASAVVRYLNKLPGLLEKMIEYYGIPPLMNTGEDAMATDLLVNIARKRGRLSRGGIPNINAAGKILATDWCSGRIQWWTEPEAITTSVSANDEKEVVSAWAEEFDLNNF
ncbi:GTPase Grn1 [Schizosaccharomyces japonicus yFS275]|uniref:GTPase Grn1 n=1 Tax=Schizosaccharomyces japonicus (strain yFS275 / FY16936) TaxID=402676 RepID=B6K5M8_SCHJY|nr:GTPase Grn1 [Schizosaccharomyces japonicus yFS275]EEB08832.1 GTPase Grn1 [Schizosaccharomyces japonicus yFS275]